MAISHVKPLHLSLLVSLFFLPSALGGTDFHNCNPLRDYPVKVKTVVISPDPVKISTNGNITITGSTMGIFCFNKHYRGAPGRPNDVRLLPLQDYT
ncbi:hypothetical protein HID58_011403 [Brassica napus]|uniref:MD-2-related lipid-recognition domain-containing protein n=1 Tax=Brassica napus TaxID=3708 RepID=A0ABQ8DY70_BRANA|nr:hypothetical protein HID58_011403 [Brassica napus]